MKNKKNILILTVIYLFTISSIKANISDEWIDQYNVNWNSFSKNASESMPLGGGDMACNVWVENGEVLVYLQKSGCFSQSGEALKLGRLRISLNPNPFLMANSNFTQKLNLKDGNILITNTSNKDTISLKLWVDIFTQSLQSDINSNNLFSINVAYESWRTYDKEIYNDNNGRGTCIGFKGYPGKVIKYKDIIYYDNDDIVFYHRNPVNPISPEVLIKQQGLEKYHDEIYNSNSNLTFGGCLTGVNMKKDKCSEGFYCATPYKSWSISSILPSKHYSFQLVTFRKQTKDIDEWKNDLKELKNRSLKEKGNLKRNIDWWREFWNKSWIVTDPYHKSNDNLWSIGRNYQLFRYQLGTNYYGSYPTKFNGGNLVFDPILIDKNKNFDPDWRNWGGDLFTAQNQRLVYWPMLKTGDFEAMKPQFDLYKRALKTAELRVKEYFGHNGAMFCEYANDYGLDWGAGWGWKNGSERNRGKDVAFGDPSINGAAGYDSPVEYGVMANSFCSYHRESQLEFSYMILEYNRFTGNNIDEYLPFIKSSLIFFDEHYQKRKVMRDGTPLDKDGKLVIYPSHSLECYRGATNPIDVVSGLKSCIESLLMLNSKKITKEEKKYFASFLKRVPDFYFDEKDGDKIILAAKSYIQKGVHEIPQLYPLFPFNRFKLNDKIMPVFRNTWKHGEFKKNMVKSWHQDGIFYARMGMTQDAYSYNMQKLADSNRRYPTFWGPGHDWVPDHNWGGSGMIGLQEMLLQTIGKSIYLLPAWPKDKDVCFKLCAPYNTTVEIKYLNGKFVEVNVVPKYREKDIVYPKF